MGLEFNREIAVFPLAARTAATYNSADIGNNYGNGVIMVVDATTSTAPTSLNVKLQGKDSLSGKYFDLLAEPEVQSAIAQIATTPSTGVAYIYPGASGTPATQDVTTTVHINQTIPRVFRVVATTVGTSWTFSVGLSLIRA